MWTPDATVVTSQQKLSALNIPTQLHCIEANADIPENKSIISDLDWEWSHEPAKLSDVVIYSSSSIHEYH